MHDTLTNTEDVKIKSMVNRFVDQLVRHAVKADMASQRDSTSTFTLQNKRNQHKTSGKYLSISGYVMHPYALLRHCVLMPVNMQRILSNTL